MRQQGQLHTKPKKSTRQQKRPPETDDEFLDQGVSLEEAAEKWRAGDAKKAARFYARALEMYDEGLRLHPRSFDLTYNKARVQYSITQLPSIRANFPAPIIDLLQTALQSHRQALSLDSTNADLLFNSAQVLTSLAEAVEDATTSTKLLQEAVALFLQCLDRQESLFEESQFQQQQSNCVSADVGRDDGGVTVDIEEDQEPSTLHWATILEPVTKTSLLDTAVAILEALSSLCTVAAAPAALAPINDIANQVLQKQLPAYLVDLNDGATKDEVVCITAKYRANLCEAEFRFGITTLTELDQRLQDIFKVDTRDASEPSKRSSAFLVCYAVALMSFAIVAAEVADSGLLQYNRLAIALDCLREASRLPNARELASIHMYRGDAEMLRFYVCTHSNVPESLSNEKTVRTLLNNAATYYRGAAGTAQVTAGMTNETTTTAVVKEAVVQCVLTGSDVPIKELASSGMREAVIQKVIADMADESLVQEGTLKSCLLL